MDTTGAVLSEMSLTSTVVALEYSFSHAKLFLYSLNNAI